MESFREIPFAEISQHALEVWPPGCTKVFRSASFLVQLFEIDGAPLRLSVCRADYDFNKRRFTDGITWDELQGIKRMVGYGESFAVEIYPEESRVVNVANMRHLWILPERLEFAW